MLGNIKKPEDSQLREWIVTTSYLLAPHNLKVQGFKKYCLFSAMDGFEDRMRGIQKVNTFYYKTLKRLALLFYTVFKQIQNLQ